MPLLKANDVALLELRDAVLCVECELISYNNTTNCLACGSSAVLNLSRVLGGSLRCQQTANLVDDETLGKIVHDTLDWIPISHPEMTHVNAARSRQEQAPSTDGGFLGLSRFNPASAMRFVVERAFTLTRAQGAALAMWQGNRMICQAHAGAAVPNIGSEARTDAGLSGLCVRTGQAWRCDDAAEDPHVNAEACRDLGIRSVIAAPLNHLNKVLGILQVLSAEAFAFDDRDVATVQLLSQLLVMAFTGKSNAREPISLAGEMEWALGAGA
jgi:GAF domain-containing protein